MSTKQDISVLFGTALYLDVKQYSSGFSCTGVRQYSSGIFRVLERMSSIN